MRLFSTVKHELSFQYRTGLVAVYGVVTGMFILLLRSVPGDMAGVLTPLVVFSELAPMGTFFVCGIVLLERGQGIVDSLLVTPLRTWEYLAARSLTLTAMGAVASLLIAASVHGAFRAWWLLVGVVLTSLLFTLLGMIISTRVSDISGFLVSAVPRLVPIVLLLYFLPVLDYVGVSIPVPLVLLPGTASLVLIGGAFGSPAPGMGAFFGAALVLTAWTALTAAAAASWFRRFVREKGHVPEMTTPRAHEYRTISDLSSKRARTRLTRVWSLIRGDLRSTLRDPLLLLPAAAPILLALAVRLGVPPLRDELLIRWQVDIAPYYELVTAAQMLLIALLTGSVVGFMILDERDEGTLLQLAVSPMGRTGYLAYRMTLPALVAFGMGSISIAAGSLVVFPAARLTAAVAAASISAPVTALILGSFAPSKVEGIALNKAVSAVILIPVSAYFVPRAWEMLLLPVGPFWIMRAVQARNDPGPDFWLYTVLAAVVHLLWLAVLSRMFERRAS